MSHVAVSHVILIIFCLYAYHLCRRCLLAPNIFLITGPAIAPNAGPANKPNIGTIGRNPSFCLRLFRLPSIYQTPRLINSFLFILKSCHLLAICHKCYDVMWGLVTTTHANIHPKNMPIFLALVLLWLLF